MGIYMKSCSTYLGKSRLGSLVIMWHTSSSFGVLLGCNIWCGWILDTDGFYLGTASTCTFWWKEILAKTITLLLQFCRQVHPLGLARIFLYLIQVQRATLLEALLDLFSFLDQLRLSIIQIACLFSCFTSCL